MISIDTLMDGQYGLLHNMCQGRYNENLTSVNKLSIVVGSQNSQVYYKCLKWVVLEALAIHTHHL
jgi:hypothetical protein